MKSLGKTDFCAKNSFHNCFLPFFFGISTTLSPARAIRTSLPSKRNSFGRRTAWLRPFMNSLAVLVMERVYTMVYTNDKCDLAIVLLKSEECLLVALTT